MQTVPLTCSTPALSLHIGVVHYLHIGSAAYNLCRPQNSLESQETSCSPQRARPSNFVIHPPHPGYVHAVQCTIGGGGGERGLTTE
jgi:hypothetical protein